LALLLLLPSLIYTGWRLHDGFPLRAAARESYLAQRLPGYAAVSALNREHPGGYRAYGLHLERLAYFADGTLLGDWFGPARFREVYARLDDPPALAAHLRRLGADYLIVPTTEVPAARLREPDFAASFALVAADAGATTLRVR
jgi:hypothetical protein